MRIFFSFLFFFLKFSFQIRIFETKTGELRIEVGPKLIFLSPTEHVAHPGQTNGVKNGINIDEVRNPEHQS